MNIDEPYQASSGCGPEEFVPLPFVLYQSVALTVDMREESINATTNIWLGFRECTRDVKLLKLHCRQCNIKSVKVNGLPCNFNHVDPLACLLRVPSAPASTSTSSFPSSSTPPSYTGEELDINMRGALEISREGELYIEISEEHRNLQPTINQLESLPSDAPVETHKRFSKLMHTFSSLSQGIMHVHSVPVPVTKSADEEGAEDVGMEGMEQCCQHGNLMKVEIEYTLTAANTSSGNRSHTCGYSFVRSLASGGQGRAVNPNPSQTQINSSKSPPAACFFTCSSGGVGALRDVDGVRCWLPCIDSPDQRAVYDVTITVPYEKQRSWEVVCSGQLVSRRLAAHSPDSNSLVSIHRYFTHTRIPAACLGIFVGRVEQYQMTMYKERTARFMVAMDIQDYDPVDGEGGDGEDSITRRNRPGGRNLIDNEGLSDRGFEETKESVLMRVEGNLHQHDDESKSFDGKSMQESDNDRMRKRVRFDGESTHSSHLSTQSSLLSSPASSTSAMSVSTIYRDLVIHTTLGLDLALRFLHKSVGKSYDHTEYTQIFVPGLSSYNNSGIGSGCGAMGDFISFDGFSLIDANLLHTQNEPHKETLAHLEQCTAYCYSWLKSALPITSYDCEFIIHGIVGYLLNIYCENVFGEDEGKYRQQKLKDVVSEWEKSDRACALAGGFPERHESLTPSHRQYVFAKSTVLIHLIENQALVNTADVNSIHEHMRTALGQIIRSPPLYAPTEAQLSRSVLQTRNGDSEPIVACDAYNNLSLTPSLSLTVDAASASTVNDSDIPLASDPASRLALLSCDCLSAPSFIATIRSACGPACDLRLSLIDRHIYNPSSTLFLRVCATVDAGSVANIKHLIVSVQEVGGVASGVRTGLGLGGGTGWSDTGLRKERENVRLHIVETKDEATTETIMNVEVGGREERYEKQIWVKAGRGAGGRGRTGRGRGRPPLNRDRVYESYRESLKEDSASSDPRVTLGKKEGVSALTLAREGNAPLKLLLVDPLHTILGEVVACVPDNVLVEQLFTNTLRNASGDRRSDIFSQIRAIRSLAKVTHSPFYSNEPSQPTRQLFQLRALSDCLQSRNQSENNATYGSAYARSSTKVDHSVYVRAEAALALAQWQNERAPSKNVPSNFLLSIIRPDSKDVLATSSLLNEFPPLYENQWGGLTILLQSIRDMYLDPISSSSSTLTNPASASSSSSSSALSSVATTSSTTNANATPLVPISVDPQDEGSNILRNCLLLSLSSIKSAQYLTPFVVTETLLLFAEEAFIRPSAHTVTMPGGESTFVIDFDDSHYKTVLLLCLSR